MIERYFGDVIQDFPNGCQLDLRVKLAVEFLKSGMVPVSIEDQAKVAADYALDLATELLATADSRGLVRELPEDDGINAPTRAHLKRNIRAQVFAQVEGQRMAAEEQSPVLAPRLVNGAPRRQ